MGQMLNEQHVGLDEVDDGVHDLCFCSYQFRRYHLQDNRIEEIVSRQPVARRQIDLARRVCPMSRNRSVSDVLIPYPVNQPGT